MADKIKSCFTKDQPHEFYLIEFEGEVIATVRDLTLSEKAYLFNLTGGNPLSWKVERMVVALGGKKPKGKEGWIYKEEITSEVISKFELDSPKIFWLIDFKLEEIDKAYREQKEAILKNLNKLSG